MKESLISARTKILNFLSTAVTLHSECASWRSILNEMLDEYVMFLSSFSISSWRWGMEWQIICHLTDHHGLQLFRAESERSASIPPTPHVRGQTEKSLRERETVVWPSIQFYHLPISRTKKTYKNVYWFTISHNHWVEGKNVEIETLASRSYIGQSVEREQLCH